MCCVLGTIFGGIYCKNNQNIYYKTNAKLFVPVNEGINKTEDVAPSLAEIFSFCRETAKSNKTLTKVISDLGLNMNTVKLSNNITVITEEASFLVKIEVKDIDSKNSINIANKIASYLMEEVKNNYNNRNIIILEEATFTLETTDVSVSKILIFCFGIGCIVGLGIIFVIFYIDEKIRTINNLENKFNIPVIGYINDYKKTSREYDMNVTESIRILRTNIESKCSLDNSKIIMITSSKKNEGKNFIASKLALAFSDIGKKILIIDCDFKTGKLHEVFNTNNKNGFSNLLSDNKDGYKKYMTNTNIDNLCFISKGTDTEKNNLFNSSSITECFSRFKETYDYIIVVTSHINNESDPLVLSRLVDKVFVVSRMIIRKKQR